MRIPRLLALALAGCAAPAANVPAAAPCPTHLCCEEAKLASPRDTPVHSETFHNASDRPVKMIWRDYDGRRHPGETVPPLGRLHSSGWKGHVIVLANEALDCQAIYRSDLANVVWDGKRILPSEEVTAGLADLKQRREAYGATFRKTELAGFEVRVSPEADRHPETVEALQLLDASLQEARAWLPADAARALASTRFWVEWNTRSGNALFQYGQTPEQLAAAGDDPARAHAVELANVKNFVQVMKDDQPWAVVHELAHALHDVVLGLKAEELEALFQKAVASKKLESVHHARGPMRRAYALNSPYEYFAERSVAYLATNSAWPFERGDFAAAEPEMYAFVARAWGERPPLKALQSKGCEGASTLPPKKGTLTAVRFLHRGKKPVKLATANEAGQRDALDGPAPGGSIRYLARAGQHFVVSREDGVCIGVYVAERLPTEVLVSAP